MTAVLSYLRHDLRVRRRQVLLLGLMGGLAAAVVLAAVAGARRTDSALDRLLEQHRYADAAVDVGLDRAAVERVRLSSGVDALGGWDFVAVQPAGLGLRAGIDVVGVVPLTDATFIDIDRPVMRAGRLPRRTGEVAVSPGLARRHHLEIGGRLPMEAATPQQGEVLFSSADPFEAAGPRFEATVVGIATDVSVLVSGDDDFGIVVLPRSFRDDFRIGHGGADDVLVFRRVLRATLVAGDAGRAGWIRDVREAFGDEVSEQFVDEDRPAMERAVAHSVEVQVAALRLFAVAAASAAGLALGHAVSRMVAAAGSDDAVLFALGMSRRQRLAVLTAPAGIVGALAAASAVALAIVASPLMPLGVARRLEPDPGMSADWVVLAAGGAAVVAFLALRGAVAAWRATTGRVRPPASSRAVEAISRSVGGVAVRVGIRFALEAGRGRTAVPVRPVLVGAIVGVAGVVGATVFIASFTRLRAEPALYGAPWDAEVVLQESSPELVTQESLRLAGDPAFSAVTAYASMEVSVGDRTLPARAATALKGPPALVLRRGRQAENPEEIMLSARDMRSIGSSLGDHVVVAGPTGERRATVVGELGGGGSAWLDGSWAEGTDVSSHGVYLTFAPDVDKEAAFVRLAGSYPEVFRPQERNDDITDLDRVRGFPPAFAGFLALLVVASVGHGLALTLRSRRKELAIVRAIGFTPAQSAAVMAWNAGTVVVVALLFGTPLGLLAGRAAWAAVAVSVHAVPDAWVPVPWAALAVLGCGAGANLVAWLPARRAARVDVASTLRVE